MALVVKTLCFSSGDASFELPGKLFGLVNIMFWDVCVYSHLAISLNRLIAITLPYQAVALLTVKKTAIAVAMAWFLGFCHIIAYFWTDTCFIYYDNVSWTWIFADTVCGYVISTYTDCYSSLAVCTAIFLLDCTTLFMLRKSIQFATYCPEAPSITQDTGALLLL
ncbi:hypothetical protein OSTOST_06773 [Ostertagia ostertagi]